MTVAQRAAKTVHLDGDSIDCREETGRPGMTYRVVTGDVIAESLPWLMDLYKSDLATFVSRIMSRSVAPSMNVRYGVNINVVEGIGGRYEWHVDPSPVAAILFVTSHVFGHGGELALRASDGVRTISPRAGLITVFEGGRLQHAVLPLSENSTRISVPMLYYDEGETQHFPEELDEYLYGRRSGS